MHNIMLKKILFMHAIDKYIFTYAHKRRQISFPPEAEILYKLRSRIAISFEALCIVCRCGKHHLKGNDRPHVRHV